jgi:hypothetical protein
MRQTGTDLMALDGPDATAAGLLPAQSGTADIVDAHVVVCAEDRAVCRDATWAVGARLV